MKIRDSVRNFFDGVSNLVTWAPIIWRDRDWDYSFLLDMLEFKLRRMGAQGFHHVWTEEKAAQVIACADACKRIREDKYAQEELAALNEKWGDRVCPVCGKSLCRCFPHYGTDGSIIGYYWVTMYENAHTSEEVDRASQEFHDLYRLQSKLLQDDVAFLCDTMKTNLLSWWD